MQNGLLGAKTIKQAARLMKANVFTAPELIEETYKNIENAKYLNALCAVRDQEQALREAEESQKRIEKSKFVKHTHSLFKLAKILTLPSLHHFLRHSSFSFGRNPNLGQGKYSISRYPLNLPVSNFLFWRVLQDNILTKGLPISAASPIMESKFLLNKIPEHYIICKQTNKS